MIREVAEFEAHDGQVVEIVGRYAVTSTGRHRMMFERPDGTLGSSNQVVQLGVEGDAWVLLGVRSDEEMEQLDGKTVVATGRLIARPERHGIGAQPDPQPTLVEIASVVGVE